HIFSINFLFPLNALLPMLIMLLFHKVLGIRTMLIGFVFSYFIQIITCLFIMKKKLNWSFTHIKANLESRLKNNIITNQALLILDSIVALLPFYLMSGFTGGIISALSYAKQLTDSPSEILTLKITQVYHIQLNENASSKDFEALNNNYLSVNYLLLFLMIPLALFTCYFAPDIVDLFFKRGEFNAQSAQNVVRFLRPLMICLITGMLAPFAASLIASTRKIKESFKYMFFKNIVILGAMYFFISRFGPFAYPYTQMGCSLFAYFVVVLFFKRHIPQIKFWLPLKDAVILVILNLIALIPAVFIGGILQNQNVFIRIFICGVIFLFALTLLYLPTKQLKKILSFLLGSRYQTFTGKLPLTLKKFFI
ncbi:MAG: hypothetical protein II972_05475, partial [Elusimicrobiaceae bacterium]|nr:hypothetical protein [Elusimicrobiaceae bacterium]